MLADGLGENGGGMHNPEAGALVVVGSEDKARRRWKIFLAGDDGGWLHTSDNAR